MYSAYQLNRALVAPVNRWASVVRKIWSHPRFPLSGTRAGRAVAGAGELVERLTRRYPKAPFALATTRVQGREVAVREVKLLETPFCELVHFERDAERDDPKVLVVAPLSGHHATLLRDTVARLLPEHDVYVTDWIDARLVPPSRGPFDLDDYVELMQRFMRRIGPELHVLAVCQACVPVLAAVSLMEEVDDPASPASMTLLAGPIDTRVSPTSVDAFAAAQPLSWFELAAVSRVPLGDPGFLRKVHPGFMQLSGFVSMNVLRHVASHGKLLRDVVAGDAEGADAHRRFYDDYLSVMDVPAEYYLQTVRSVFQRHELARGEMKLRGTRLVRPDLVRRAALMTVEGAKDDICGRGQTEAAHRLCSSVPPERRRHLVAEGVGHFGVFSGRRWREEIAPRVCEFIRASARAPGRRPAANSPAGDVPVGVAATPLAGN